jgi:hypothetical protein
MVVLFMIFISLQAFGQVVSKSFEEPTPILKFNILSPIVGTLSFQYEKPIDSHSSNQYGFYIFTGDIAGAYIPAIGFGVTYDYRYYLLYENQRDFYIQPFVRCQTFFTKLGVNNNNVSSYSVPGGTNLIVLNGGFVLGKQWILFKRLVFDAFAGPMYSVGDSKNAIPVQDIKPFYSGFWYRAGITAGYKFN